MALKIDKSLVSVDWLKNNLSNENLIILDCTIPKVTAQPNTNIDEQKLQIPGAVLFDIKNTFSDKTAKFPNTVLRGEEFEKKVQALGVNQESAVVCYDDVGIYSSPRVWWNFKLMGFNNIAVLNGGLPKWKAKNYPLELPTLNKIKEGSFRVNYQPNKVKYTKDILSAIKDKNVLIADARSEGRFYGTVPEPRKDVKSGHIPNSVSLPYSSIIEDDLFKSEEELSLIFNNLNPKKKELIFSCGTGITASVLALAAEILGNHNYAVYDGSWTEWGSTENLPIEI